MGERWRVIEDWPNYEISSLGRVRNVRTGRLLSLGGRSKYIKVTLCHAGRYVPTPVHILVATAFVHGCFEGALVNHKDGNKHNNRATNLEWATHQENMEHASRTGLQTGRGGWRTIAVIQPKER
jgi:hypothetical protein